MTKRKQPLLPKPAHLLTGEKSELRAEQFLRQQGLTLVTRNYRCKLGEIDLIMRDGEHLVFVEVRFRKHRHYGSASETVGYHKQRKLIRTAQYYLLMHPNLDVPCRFDVVALHGINTSENTELAVDAGNERQKPIEWITNAFTA